MSPRFPPVVGLTRRSPLTARWWNGPGARSCPHLAPARTSQLKRGILLEAAPAGAAGPGWGGWPETVGSCVLPKLWFEGEGRGQGNYLGDP